MRNAAKVDKAHSERNAHRLFKRYGRALRVPITYLNFRASESGDNVSIPYLRATDVLTLLLAKYEQVLFRGLRATASEELCSPFLGAF